MTKLTLSEALLKFKATEIKVVKDSKNSFYANSEYADINNVLRTIQPTLNDLGIVIVQSVAINELGNDVLNTKIFMSHDSKDCMESSVRLIMPQGKENMQTLGAAVTYARRYGIISMFSLEAIGQDADEAYNKPLTPAQQFGAKVVAMKKDLDMARAEGDIDKATRIYEEAGDKGLIQVQDYHARLFENPVATL